MVRAPEAPLRCGKLAGPLDVDASMLADRIKLRVPKGTTEIPRGFNLMDAPTPTEEETRLMLGGGVSAGKAPGDDTLAILARETWELDPDRAQEEADAVAHPGSLDEEAPKLLSLLYGGAEAPLDVEPVAVADASIRAYAARPREVKVRPGADAALVLAVLTALPDATLQSIGFYVTPSLLGDAAGCAAYAERIAASLSTGWRTLDRSPGVRKLRALSPTEVLTVTVPRDYVVVHQRGPDFDRYKIFHLRPLGLYPGAIVVMVDPYPHCDCDAPNDATAHEKGTLLGREVTWHGQRGPAGGALYTTVALPHGYAHLVVQATRQEKYLDEFLRVASTLAVERP
jgi:hypothetical protein